MPRATGPIGYIEHRSPRKDENGKYIIHPQFVQKEMSDAEKMAHDSQGRCMTNGAQFVSVMDTIETLTLQALGRGDAVRIGDTPYSSVGVAVGVSRAADSRGTSVPRESAARSTVVARPSDVRSQPLWSYVDIPYRRTSTSPYVVHPYLLWILFLSF